MSSPHDQPFTFTHGREGGQPGFTGAAAAEWHPSDFPTDPHEEPFTDIGDEIEPVEGEVPPNIVGGSRSHIPGPFSRSKGL